MNEELIRIEVIKVPGCAPAVLPSEMRVAAGVKRMRDKLRLAREDIHSLKESAKQQQLEDDEDTRAETIEKVKDTDRIEALIERTVAGNAELRKMHAGNVQALSFLYYGYNFGDKVDARAKATTYDHAGNPSFDITVFQMALTCAALQMSEADLRAQPPAVAEALVSECLERSEPDPSRLDFLVFAPPSSEIPVA